MSQSPQTTEEPSDDYVYSWVALSEFLASGGSLSGREANCCFLNTQESAFADISAVSGFNFKDDGRAVALCDWDHDGALDLWIANRTGPRVRFMHNNLPRKQSQFVSVRLMGTESNRDAIGSSVILELEDGALHRSLRAGEGFLSQSTKWIHFGFANDRKPKAVQVRWPNGSTERFDNIAAGTHYSLTEGSGQSVVWNPTTKPLELKTSKIKTDASLGGARRTILAGPFQVPELEYLNLDDAVAPIVSSRHAVLVNLWSSTCKPCLAELSDLEQHRNDFATEDLQLIALNVDPQPQHDAARAALRRVNWTGRAGFADEQLVHAFDILQRVVFSQRRPLPLPSSFLIDPHGNLAAIYVGQANADQLLADWKVISAHDGTWQPKGLPFQGTWMRQPAAASNTLTELTFEFMNAGLLETSQSLLNRMSAKTGDGTSPTLAVAHLNMGAELSRQNRIEDASREFREAIRLDPSMANAHYALGLLLKQQGQRNEALRSFQQTTKADPTHADANMELAMAYAGGGMAPQAIAHAEAALASRSDWIAPMNVLARILALHPDPNISDRERALQLVERAVDITERKDAQSLTTLAVVQGSIGDFENAVLTAEEGLRIANASGKPALAVKLNAHLKKFRQALQRKRNE